MMKGGSEGEWRNEERVTKNRGGRGKCRGMQVTPYGNNYSQHDIIKTNFQFQMFASYFQC